MIFIIEMHIYKLWGIRVLHGQSMKSPHVPSNAKRVAAAKVAQLAGEFHAPIVVHVSHVTLHVCLVHALVGARGALKLAAPWIHFAANLNVTLEQAAQVIGLLAVGTCELSADGLLLLWLINLLVRELWRHANQLVLAGPRQL